jgi:hypothetical protein
MLAQLIMFGISISSIVLGFFALLRQKTYIDSATNQPVEVEIKTFGKLKTNYPALVFVFLGFAAAFLAFPKSVIKEKVPWVIKGQLVDSSHKIDDWREGDFQIVPQGIDVSIDKATGAYTIRMDIEKGESFEDAVKCIIYSHQLGQIQFCPESELQNKRKNMPSVLTTTDDPTRFYKPIQLSLFN